MEKKISNVNGFSVAALLVAAGMMGGLALVLAQISKQQMIIQRKAEAGAEIGELTLNITNLLKNEQACFNTIGANTTLAANTTYTRNSILNEDNNIVFRSSTSSNPTTYRNQLIRIDSIELTDVEIDNTVGNLSLQIDFVKHGKSITGAKQVTKKIPLSVEVDTANSNEVLRCISLENAPVAAAKQDLCIEWGGQYDPGSQTCNSLLANRECPGPDPNDPTDTTPQEFLAGVNNDMTLNCKTLSPFNPPTNRNCYLLTTYLIHWQLDFGVGNPSLWIPPTPSGITGPTRVSMMGRGGNIWRRLPAHPMGPPWKRFGLETMSAPVRNFLDNSKSTCASGYNEFYRKATKERINTAELMYHYCCK